MEPPSDTKSCTMCCSNIPRQARKCPFCRHVQNYGWFASINPNLMGLILVLPLTLGMVLMFARLLDPGEDFAKYSSQVVAKDSEIVFGDSRSGPTVAAMGTLRNASDVPWDKLEFHVDFMDAKGKRIDVGGRSDYNLHLPARGMTSFKVSFPREFPAQNYVKAIVQVVAAKDSRAKF